MKQQAKPVAPSLEESRHLYEAAIRVKKMAPWEWIHNGQVFGVQNPETGELGFVCIIGMDDEKQGVGLFLGTEGLFGLFEIGTSIGPAAPELWLEVPQLQLLFEDRDRLEPEDLKLVRKLGFKFRGDCSWPVFRSYCPGYSPWFLTSDETRFLTLALTQILEFAPRVKSHPELLEFDDEREDEFLVRVPHKTDKQIVWKDERMRVKLPGQIPVDVYFGEGVLELLGQLPHCDVEFELEMRLLPLPTDEPGVRPGIPFLLMMVEPRTGAVVQYEMMEPGHSRVELLGEIPLILGDWLITEGIIPKQINLTSQLLISLLNPLAEELQFKLNRSTSLPAFDRAFERTIDAIEISRI